MTVWPPTIDTNAQMRLVTFLDNHDQPRFLSSEMRTTTHKPPRRRSGFSLHLTRHSVPVLRHRTGLQTAGPIPTTAKDMFAGWFKDGPAAWTAST